MVMYFLCCLLNSLKVQKRKKKKIYKINFYEYKKILCAVFKCFDMTLWNACIKFLQFHIMYNAILFNRFSCKQF